MKPTLLMQRVKRYLKRRKEKQMPKGIGYSGKKKKRGK